MVFDLPAASVFPGIEREALPLLKLPEVEKLPLLNVTVPVGFAEPVPATVTATESASVGLAVACAGATVTVGVFLESVPHPITKRVADTNRSTALKPALQRRILPGISR